MIEDSRTRLSLQEARNVYEAIREEYQILGISSLDTMSILTNDFMDRMIKSKLTFKDGLHLEIARIYNKTPVCTHDKHMKDSSTHEDKKKFYSKVFKPSELISPKK